MLWIHNEQGEGRGVRRNGYKKVLIQAFGLFDIVANNQKTHMHWDNLSYAVS